MNIRINAEENVFFALKVVVSVFVYLIGLVILIAIGSVGAKAFAVLFVFLFYGLFIVLFFVFRHILFIGYIRGNGVRLSEKQFPEVFEMARSIAGSLNIGTIPKIYLLQSGGVINAFATRLLFRNYIVLYSEVFEMAYKDMEILKFVLAHELGHVHRKHISKRFWTLPSLVVPFLDSAYSRACEYTCDNIGGAFSGNPVNGLLLLAAGTDLYNKVNIEEYLATFREDDTLLTVIVQLFMSHPYLPNRIQNILGR
jgi:Zn-dependent protease with chaperone function